MIEANPDRAQLASEIAHWRFAVEALEDLETLASPQAWAGLEEYLRLELRNRLGSVVSSLGIEAIALDASYRAGADTSDVRQKLLQLRGRYLQAETVLSFFGDALATRANPKTGAILRGLDVIAADSMELVLRPLGIEAPPALVYLDKGLGASILRAGVRLWDRANPSPVAAIKLTRHNLSHPTALIHETGHQVNHLTGWNGELAALLQRTLAPRSAVLAEAWQSWTSEVAADVYAFALAGSAPLPALANVVDGPTAAVYRLIPGDPHPFPWVRVMFNVALCRAWFGAGEWDRIAAAWMARHPPAHIPGLAGEIARLSMKEMDAIVAACTRVPARAFGGRPLTALADPGRSSPAALSALAERAGASLTTSSYLERHEAIRILSWLASRPEVDPAQGNAHRRTLLDWLARIGRPALARST